VKKIEREREGSFLVDKTEEGEYRACFRNLEKDLAFISFEMHAPESDNIGRSVGVEQLTGVTEEIKETIRSLRRVKTNLHYQEFRERVHTDNLQSLMSGIKWSTFFKVLSLACIGGAQIYILTGFFKKKARVTV